MAWTKERLEDVARTRLGGAKLIVVANREPYIHRYHDGEVEWIRPAGGLTTALDPVMRACGGVWVAHGSGDADRDVARRRRPRPRPAGRPELRPPPRLAHEGRGGGVLLRVRQQHPVAALPPGVLPADVRPRPLGRVPQGERDSSPRPCSRKRKAARRWSSSRTTTSPCCRGC